MGTYLARAVPLTAEDIAAWPMWRRVRNNALALATPLL